MIHGSFVSIVSYFLDHVYSFVFIVSFSVRCHLSRFPHRPLNCAGTVAADSSWLCSEDSEMLNTWHSAAGDKKRLGREETTSAEPVQEMLPFILSTFYQTEKASLLVTCSSQQSHGCEGGSAWTSLLFQSRCTMGLWFPVVEGCHQALQASAHYRAHPSLICLELGGCWTLSSFCAEQDHTFLPRARNLHH